MRVYDCFTFFNEIELLKVRMGYLSPHVDYFVICESTHTHSGVPKPLYFREFESDFDQWRSKIIHLVHEPDEIDSRNMVKPDFYDVNAPQWTLERAQRDHLLTGLKGVSDGDAVVVTDVDEIWSHQLEPLLRDTNGKISVARIEMFFFYYYMNCIGVGQNNRRWTHPYFLRWNSEMSNVSLSHLRTNAKLPAIKEMGWHFSYLGGPQKIQEKMEAFAHQEFNHDIYKETGHIELCLELGVDHLGRDGVEWAFIPPRRLPRELLDAASSIEGCFKYNLK